MDNLIYYFVVDEAPLVAGVVVAPGFAEASPPGGLVVEASLATGAPEVAGRAVVVGS